MQVVGILKEMVETTMESYEGFRISEGKKVYLLFFENMIFLRLLINKVAIFVTSVCSSSTDSVRFLTYNTSSAAST
jgi:hypothetical protein